MRNWVLAGLGVGAVLPLVFAPSASAVLTLAPSSATPGQVVTVTGTSYSNAAGVSPVRIRLSKREGQILKSEAPNGAGRISTTFVVPPSLAPGDYLIIGTQTNDSTGQTDVTRANADGTQRGFTPSRAVLRVRAAGAAGAAAPPAPGDGPGGGFAVPVLVLILAPGVLAAALARTARRRWALDRPQPGHPILEGQ